MLTFQTKLVQKEYLQSETDEMNRTIEPYIFKLF